MAEEAQKSYESRIPAIRSAAYDDGYAAGIEDGRSSDASIQRRLANLRDSAELEFYRSNVVFVTVSGENITATAAIISQDTGILSITLNLPKKWDTSPV